MSAAHLSYLKTLVSDLIETNILVTTAAIPHLIYTALF